VDAHGRALSSVVRRSVASTSWRAAQEPRGPRPVCDLLLERLGRAEAEVGRLVEASGRGGGEGGGGGHWEWMACDWVDNASRGAPGPPVGALTTTSMHHSFSLCDFSCTLCCCDH
jgi:hypothetical protein